jgi:hypothetical protein
VPGCCEQGNELSGCVSVRRLLGQLSDYLLLNKTMLDVVSWLVG